TQPLTSEAIPAISPRSIEPFLTQPLLIEEGGLDRAPRIIATEENRVNLGAGNVAYVSGFGGSDASVWQIYRAGQPLVDPDNQSDYLKSRERSPVIQLPPERYGLAFVFRTFDSVSYALVMESSRPVQGGDIVQNP